MHLLVIQSQVFYMNRLKSLLWWSVTLCHLHVFLLVTLELFVFLLQTGLLHRPVAQLHILFYFLFFPFFFFKDWLILVTERGERGRGRKRKKLKQTLCWAQSLMRAWISWPWVETWARTKSWILKWLHHLGVPQLSILIFWGGPPPPPISWVSCLLWFTFMFWWYTFCCLS